MNFKVRDPDYEQRTRANFESQGFMYHLGTEMTKLLPGYCELQLSFREELAQQHGYFHGGVIATLADVSGGYAAFTLLKPGITNVTVEFKLNLLSPGIGQRLVARGSVVKAGRILTISKSDVSTIDSEEKERLCATSLATYMALR
jgi:uncharacterized protein (TIGR00369 family)